ncbi:MAG: hypothetical protein IKM54_04895, partial [Butyricicoccus sp.]|nr:hypothetical protein [Butyricicoccus sp.]
MKKRVLSLFLIVVMLFTMCPVTVSAADDVVYLSVSLDESYIEGSSSQKIVQMPISLSDVAAVDLDKYKLGDYAKDEYGNDISTEPTLLKLFIYAHENIYNGSWNDVTVSGEPLAIYFQEGLFGFSANVNYYVNGEYQYFDKPGAFGGGFHEIGCSCGSCYAMG